MKEEFFVIEHNQILRIIYLKYNTLLTLSEYSKNIKNIKDSKKDIKNVKKNLQINTELKKNANTSVILDDITNSKSIKTIENKNEINENKNNIFSPTRKEAQDVIVDVNDAEVNEELENEEMKKKCISGCDFCSKGCGLIGIGFNYVCTVIYYYINKCFIKIKSNC